MARPNSNGIVALHDDKESNGGFFCIKLVGYLNEEAEMGTEFYEVLWHERFAQAKAGDVPIGINAPFMPNLTSN